MSGTPTETEIQTQWRACVNLLEKTRVHSDDVAAVAAGLMDVIEQNLEGQYTPTGLANAVARFRAGLSDLASPGRAIDFMESIIYEYGNILTEGSGYQDLLSLMRAIYEHFHANSLTVESRAITYDTSATAGASNVGNGAMHRLTVDEFAYDLEACHVETKRFRCRGDVNSGVQEHAESFECLGDTASQDALLRASYGSGESSRVFFRSKHAGSGAGGSLLRNSSFSTYSATASPKFLGWTESAVGGGIAQDTTNFYRSHPGASTDGSLQMTGGGGTITLKQTLASMRVSKLDPDTPYFLRVMLNKTVGTAVGGTVNLRLGSQTVSVTIAAMGANWVELKVPLDTNLWFRNFNEASFDVEIEWVTSTSGTLLIDDMILVPMDLIDGTFWTLVGGATPWLVDDTLAFTDTGGAPATAKIQWWLWVAGLGYLPHTTGVPTFTEPV